MRGYLHAVASLAAVSFGAGFDDRVVSRPVARRRGPNSAMFDICSGTTKLLPVPSKALSKRRRRRLRGKAKGARR